MTETEIAARVARKLTVVHYGEFYVGQRVKHTIGKIGNIESFYTAPTGTPCAIVAWDRAKPLGAHLANLRAIDSPL